MPMGTALVVQKDTSDFVRLSQLGDILGLTPMQAASVHQSLAEQAFTNQAQVSVVDKHCEVLYSIDLCCTKLYSVVAS